MKELELSQLAPWLATVASYEAADGHAEQVKKASLDLVAFVDSPELLALADFDYLAAGTREDFSNQIIRFYAAHGLVVPSKRDYLWILAMLAFRSNQRSVEISKSWSDLNAALEWEGELSDLLGVAIGLVDQLDINGELGEEAFERITHYVNDRRDWFELQYKTFVASTPARWVGSVFVRKGQ